MKLVLCSEAFATPNTVQACVELCDKPQDQISVAIINEAYAVEEGDKHWVINNMNSAAENFSGEIDIIDLLALSPAEAKERLSSKDVIFMIGGNTDYLMTVLQKTGFDTVLRKLLESKVYVGSSAGSMIVGRRISAEAYHLIYGEDSPYDIQEYLNLVDFSIMPHLDSPHFANRKDTLLQSTASFKGKVYGLRDDSAVVVNGDSIRIIGSEPVVIN